MEQLLTNLLHEYVQSRTDEIKVTKNNENLQSVKLPVCFYEPLSMGNWEDVNPDLLEQIFFCITNVPFKTKLIGEIKLTPYVLHEKFRYIILKTK